MSLSVVRFDGSPEAWDELVRASSGWTHFHLHGWKDVIESQYGHECLYLAATDGDGGLAGVLPLVRVKSRIFGDYLVSMPFVNYGGPLGTPEAVAALTDHAADLAHEMGVDLLELRSRISHDSVSLPVSHRKVTVLLDLPAGDPEALWEDLKSKVRSQVRRPRKEGVQVRFGASELGPFYDVYSEHMRDLGTPAQSRGLFEALARVFSDSVWFGCAYLRGRPVAAGCGFRWGEELEMTWASALRAHSRIAPNMLLYWSFMEKACQEGLERFNFGRCSPGSGTHRFKLQWGGRDQELWWYQATPTGETAATPAPDQGFYALGTRIWSQLPLPVARALGPRLVQYIP